MDLHLLDIAVVLVLGLLIFGPKRLPELGSQLGRAIREFQHMLRDDQPAATPPAPVTPPTVAQPTPAVALEEPPARSASSAAQESIAGEPHQD